MNSIDIFQRTSRRIAEKLARFEKLLRDPDLAPYVSALNNGKLPKRPVQGARKSGARVKPAATSGIRDAIRSLKRRLPPQFTADDISRELQRANFTFGTGNQGKAIQNTLFKLSVRREIKLVKSGSGGKPNTYTWTVRKSKE